MQCTVCGKQLNPDILYCPTCRSATPALGANFAELERRLAQLQTRRKTNMVSETDFKAEVQKLVVLDAAGNSWWLQGKHGAWSWFDGQKWEPRDPAQLDLASARPPSPATPVAPLAPTATSPSTKGNKHRWPYLLIGCLGLGFIAVLVAGVAGFFLLRDNGITVGERTNSQSAGNVEAPPAEPVEALTASDMAQFREAMAQEIVDHRPQTLELMGRPDAFSITELDVEGVKVTREIWYYFGLLTRVDFFNGEAAFTTALEPVPEDTIFPAWYDPLSFSAGMTAAEVIEVARTASPAGQAPEVAGVDGLADEFPGGELLIGDQILIGLYDGRVLYVESVALFPEETQQ